MARFSKIKVLEAMNSTGMVPVFYSGDAEVSMRVLKACYDGGVRAFEFTNRGDFAIDVFKRLELFARVECPEMILGAGSIVDAPTAALYIQYGANFIVGPYFNPEIAPLCNRHLIAYTPAVFRQECKGSAAVGSDYGHGCGRADRGESLSMVQGRRLLRRYGLQAFPERGYCGRRLGPDFFSLPKCARYNKSKQITT